MFPLTRSTTTVVLTCAILLGSAVANAQARGPSRSAPRQADERSVSGSADEAAARQAKLAAMEAWLAHLVGRFRLEGTISAKIGSGICAGQSRGFRDCYLESQSRGVADCRNVGSGPGVLCRIDVPWPRFSWSQVIAMARPPGGAEPRFSGPNLEGAMILYGIDPDNLGIRFLLVDGESMAVEALGFLEGDRAESRTGCVNAGAGRRCEWAFQTRIRGGNSPIEMRFNWAVDPSPAIFEFVLRREVQSQADEAPELLPAERQ